MHESIMELPLMMIADAATCVLCSEKYHVVVGTHVVGDIKVAEWFVFRLATPSHVQ
jgi:hypothetical protein